MLEHSPLITRGLFEKTLNGENDGIPFRRITDGTSKTVMLGEVRQFAGNDGRGVFYLGQWLVLFARVSAEFKRPG